MEFVDQEDHDQDMTCEFNNLKMDIPIPNMAAVTSPEAPPQPRKPRYKECLKNHALSLGGHAVDGCGEFMPAGSEGTIDALKCAACDCHRNFHRKETDENSVVVSGAGGGIVPPPYMQQPHFLDRRGGGPAGYLHVGVPQQRLLALPCSISGGGQHSREEYQEGVLNSSGGGSGKKRFRTKFTQEQKEKMFELAESLGWRMQKHDEDGVQQFCDESGISRNVFKVWMHNNKNNLRKKP